MEYPKYTGMNNLDKNILNNEDFEERKDTQFYLITLEDSNGEHKQIRVFKNSDPAEIAFNFCKENNLDFKSMKYIKKNIQKIIEQFDEPNHKLFFLDNSYSSIQEVDEENLASENTFKSKNSIVATENNNIKEKNINNNKEKNNNINSITIDKKENINNLNNIKQNKSEENNNKDNNKNENNGITINNKNKILNINNDNNVILTKNKNKNKNNYIVENEKNTEINNDNNNYNKNNINEKDNYKDIINEKIKDKMKDKIKEKIILDNNIKTSYNQNTIENNKRDNNIFLQIKNNIKNLNEKNNDFDDQNKFSYNENQEKLNKKLNDYNKEKNKEIKKINSNIVDKKIENKNTKNNIIKIKKEFITNLFNKNIITDRANNNHNKAIKLQNIIPKLFKNINPKQHLINEEYKTLIKKENNTNREKENIIQNYLKCLDKNIKQDSKNKNNFKTIEKHFQEKDKCKTNETFVTINHSNLNLKTDNRDKDKTFDNNNAMNITNKNKNKNLKKLESIKVIQKNTKSLSNVNKNCIPSHLLLKLKKSSNTNISFNQKKALNSRIRRILRNNNKDVFDNLLSHTFINHNNTRNYNKQLQQNMHHTQIDDKSLILNKSTKNKVIIRRNKKNLFENKDYPKLSCDLNKYNEMNQNIIFDKSMRTFEGESRSKSKRISEMRNGLNKMFNNFIGQKNNILNTNYIINKRCRIINNKNKKTMSMNLSRYFIDYSQKRIKSPKYNNLEINVSNNNYDNNLNIKDYKISKNHHKKFYTKSNNVLSNNHLCQKEITNIDNKNNNNKKRYYILLNSQNQPIFHRYNKSSRFLNSNNSNYSYSKTKKKIIIKNKNNSNKISNYNSSLKKRKYIASKFKDINNNINISNSLLFNNDKTNPINDYCLKKLDQYYTINNTINITNNNSLLSNFSNNNMSNKKNNYKKDTINNLKYLIKNIFKFLDKDKNGFIILNNKKRFNKNYKNNFINNEFFKILEKMMKILYEINKRENNMDFNEDNIIINANNFIKYMIYIYTNKLNINEKKIFSSLNINDLKKIIKKKDYFQNNLNYKSSFNKYKDNKNIVFPYNSSSRLNKKIENKIRGSNDINKFLFYKINKNDKKKRLKFNSFNDL